MVGKDPVLMITPIESPMWKRNVDREIIRLLPMHAGRVVRINGKGEVVFTKVPTPMRRKIEQRPVLRMMRLEPPCYEPALVEMFRIIGLGVR